MFGAARRNSVPKHLSTGLQCPMRRINGTAALNTAQRFQQHGCGYVPDRPTSQYWENISLKPRHNLPRVAFSPTILLTVEPFSRNDLKSAVGICPGGFFGGLFVGSGIYPRSNLPLGLLTTGTGILQPDGGVRSKAQRLALSFKTIVHPPELSPCRSHIQVKATAVRKFLRLVSSLHTPQRDVR